MRQFPVIVTAFDNMYYPASMGLFYSIHTLQMTNPEYGQQVKIVVYDIGLSKRQLHIVIYNAIVKFRPSPILQKYKKDFFRIVFVSFNWVYLPLSILLLILTRVGLELDNRIPCLPYLSPTLPTEHDKAQMS